MIENGARAIFVPKREFIVMGKLFGKPKIGLALSGGAARGLAHIGVLKVLEEERIPVSCVAGTSVGSLVGALFADGMGWRKMADTARKLKWKNLASISLSPLGLARTEKLEEVIDGLLGGKRFEELSLPFAAVAVDIGTGEKVVFRTGSVAEAVRASASIPGIFEPLILNGRYLVDGGVLDNLPGDVAREMGADFVIACDLNTDRVGEGRPKNLIDILYRSFQIMLGNSRSDLLPDDVLIAPDLEGKNFHDLKPLDEYIALGEAAARAKIGLIRKRAKL